METKNDKGETIAQEINILNGVKDGRKITSSESDDVQGATKLFTDEEELKGEKKDFTENRLKRYTQEWRALFTWDGNKDAKALCMVHIAGGSDAIATSVFLSSAILELAYEAANCPKRTSDNEFPECNNRVYGMKPSSLLSMYLVALGLSSSFFMPLVGALVDSTGHRRAIGRISVAINCVTLALRGFISSKTWFFISILQFFVDLVSAVNRLMYYAYIPELTNDKSLMAKYNASISISFNLSIVLFLVTMTVAANVFGISDDNVKTARVAMVLSFIIHALFNGYSWARLFGLRQKKFQDADIKNSLSKSTHRLYNTLKKVFRERSDLKWILLSRSFVNAALLATSVIIMTYMKNDLGFSSSEIGVGVLLMLIFALPGNKMSVTMSRKLDPLRSLRLCYIMFVALTLILPLIVSSNDHKIRLYIILMLWGMSIGWKEPTDKTLFSELITKSHEAEMMGIYIFASQILLWLPPLIFTVMNEAGINIRISIASIAGYYLLGIMFLILVGNFESAVNKKILQEENEKNEVVDDPKSTTEDGGA